MYSSANKDEINLADWVISDVKFFRLQTRVSNEELILAV